MYCRVLNSMSTDVSEVRAASIIRAMMVDIEFRTRQYIPEDFELHTHRRENLKSHLFKIVCTFKSTFISTVHKTYIFYIFASEHSFFNRS
jgi:hypothetical protein